APRVANTNAMGKCTIMAWIGWPATATADCASRSMTSAITGLSEDLVSRSAICPPCSQDQCPRRAGGSLLVLRIERQGHDTMEGGGIENETGRSAQLIGNGLLDQLPREPAQPRRIGRTGGKF